MTAQDVFRRITSALDRAGIVYMLTGSFASSYHGTPRATQDIDLVIEASPDQVRALVAQLPSAEYYVDLAAALRALQNEGQFNVIDLATGWKIDLMSRKSRPFSRAEFDRRLAIELEGVPLYVANQTWPESSEFEVGTWTARTLSGGSAHLALRRSGRPRAPPPGSPRREPRSHVIRDFLDYRCRLNSSSRLHLRYPRRGKRLRRRDLLSDLRALTGAARAAVLSLPGAAAALRLSQREATLRMGALVRLGAVHRIARGLFFIVPIKTADPRSERPRDAAVVASALFRPCYIGGWSAADAWSLSMSLRPEVFVVTSSRVRAASVQVGEIRFRLAHTPERLIVGPGIVSRSGGASAMSGPERTLVDALRSPSWLGGARPLARALGEHRRSNRWDPDRFVEMLVQAGNGAAINRLDAFDQLMVLGIADVLNSVAERRTRGIVDLEPGAETGGRIDTRCRVRVNVDLDGEDTDEDPEFLDDLEDFDP